jgi:hypothetical protein
METETSLKYLTPENLYQQITQFTAGMAVTKDEFELVVPSCTLEDIEWNHMDQMHRPAIHNTYEKGIRIALGTHFSLSLTQWKKWPIFIPVTDVYVDKGLFYQSMTIGGIFFLHSIISMTDIGNNSIKLKDEWYIASHKFFRFLHKPLSKMLYRLNVRLQQEDEQIRQERFALRKEGYTFRTDNPNFYNSNILNENTIYPKMMDEVDVCVNDVSDVAMLKKAENIEFIIKKENNIYFIWPAACPHEGGPLVNGKFSSTKITCPWHGLHFSAVQLSKESPAAFKYGFEYRLSENIIYIKQKAILEQHTCLSQKQESVPII